MAEALVNNAAGIVTMDTTNDTYSVGGSQMVDHMVLTCTAAGAFAVTIDNASISLNVSVNEQTKVVPLRRSVKEVVVTGVPTGGKVYLFLDKSRG